MNHKFELDEKEIKEACARYVEHISMIKIEPGKATVHLQYNKGDRNDDSFSATVTLDG